MLPGGRQAASDMQGMNGKTDSDQFAAESERVSLADFSGQKHRWNCPKANRIDDTEWQPKRLYAAFIPIG